MILNTISALLEWDMFIGSLWFVVLGIIAYHTILVSGSFVKSFNALASVLHAEILRAEKVIKAAWENHHTGLDKGAARTMKHFEPAEQLHQRYQAWMQEKEDAWTQKPLRKATICLRAASGQITWKLLCGEKADSRGCDEAGDWTAVKQVKTSEIYKELLPTEKDVLRRQNMNKNYAAFLQKRSAISTEKICDRAAHCFGIIRRRSIKMLKKPKRWRKRCLRLTGFIRRRANISKD